MHTLYEDIIKIWLAKLAAHLFHPLPNQVGYAPKGGELAKTRSIAARNTTVKSNSTSTVRF